MQLTTLTANPGVTRTRARTDDDVVRQVAFLLRTSPAQRALPARLASWHQTRVRAVIAAGDPASWSRRGLVDAFAGAAGTIHVEVHAPCRRRSHRIIGGGLGAARQLELGGER